jgi:hypothetical protein
MPRLLICALFMLGLCFTVVVADDYKGKVKTVNADTKSLVITITDGDKTTDKTFEVPADAKIYTTAAKGKGGKGKKKGGEVLIEGGLSGVKVDSTVTVTTDKKDNKETVTAVKVEPMGKKKKAGGQ